MRIASPNGFVKVTQGSGSRVEIQADKVIRRGSIEDVGFVVRRGSEGITVCAVFEDEDEAVALMVDGGFQEGSEARAKYSRARLSSTQLSTYFAGSRSLP